MFVTDVSGHRVLQLTPLRQLTAYRRWFESQAF
jgi:hypothetical protein